MIFHFNSFRPDRTIGTNFYKNFTNISIIFSRYVVCNTFQKYIIVKFKRIVEGNSFSRSDKSIDSRLNRRLIFRNRGRQTQGNRLGSRGEGRKQVFKFSRGITRIRKLCPPFVNLFEPRKIGRGKRELDGSIERFDTVYGNKSRSRTCVSRTRAPIGAEVARYQRDGPVNLYRKWK